MISFSNIAGNLHISNLIKSTDITISFSDVTNSSSDAGN